MKIISHDKKVHMDLQNIIILALIGIASGLLSGTMGLGGAIIIIPALVMLLGFSQQMAQGTTLMMMVLPVGAMAAYHYHQQGFVDIKAVLSFSLAAIMELKWPLLFLKIFLKKFLQCC
jgi:uncharacterized membrane protein YfcA